LILGQLNADELQEILRKFYGKISLQCTKNICPDGTLPWSERPGECIKVSNYVSKVSKTILIHKFKAENVDLTV